MVSWNIRSKLGWQIGIWRREGELIIISNLIKFISTHSNNPEDASVGLHVDLTGAFVNVAEVHVVPDMDSRKYCSVDWN